VRARGGEGGAAPVCQELGQEGSGAGQGRRRRKERKEREKGQKKRKEKKKKIGKGEKKIKKNRKNGKGKEKEKGFSVSGEFLGKFGGKEKRDFAEFFGFRRLRDFGTAVMARRTGRRDRGVRGIPGAVADNGARVTGGGVMPRVRAVLAGFAARALRVREGEDDRGSEGDK
jgi:hypothetical protein